MGETVAVTRGESAPVVDVGADGLDLADDTSATGDIRNAFGMVAAI